MSPSVLKVATRGSPLALRQTDIVAGLLAEATGMASEPVIVSTSGDRQAETAIHAMGGKGVFVKEVQDAVLNRRADLAVHSAKDLPSVTPEGLVLAAILERSAPEDALVGCKLRELPQGATVATGSVRRKAQLAWMRPDLRFRELRGNIATRLARAADFDAIAMAAVALQRLDIQRDDLDVLAADVFVPQVGQGAIAVECRADDHQTLELLQAVQHEPSRLAVDAERAFLAELGGDCDLPAGAHATVANGSLELTAFLAALDGSVLLRETLRGTQPDTLGHQTARRLLDDRGGRALLEDDCDSQKPQRTRKGMIRGCSGMIPPSER